MFDGQLNNDSAVDNGIHMSEERQIVLMRELTGDDEELAGYALGDIMNAYKKPLEAQARRDVPFADCESLVQEAFMSLWESREKLNPESVRIYKWLLTAVKRRAQNEKRNAATRKTVVEPLSSGTFEIMDEELGEMRSHAPESPEPTPDKIAEDNELGALIREAKDTVLNERERLAITLKLEEDQTFNVVADRLGCKLATAKSTVRNAKKKLREWLESRV